jgi:hypothetical protein
MHRAQALRMKNDLEGALRDVNKAIELCSYLLTEDESCGSSSTLSTSSIAPPQRDREKTRLVLKQALGQRAVIKKQRGEVESANEDLKLLSKLAAPENYYAKLCNQTIAEVLAAYYHPPAPGASTSSESKPTSTNE